MNLDLDLLEAQEAYTAAPDGSGKDAFGACGPRSDEDTEDTDGAALGVDVADSDESREYPMQAQEANKEMDWFRELTDLEVEIERRCSLKESEQEEGVIGVMLSIDVPRVWGGPAADTAEASFLECMNGVVGRVSDATGWKDHANNMGLRSSGAGRGATAKSRARAKVPSLHQIDAEYRHHGLPYLHEVEATQRRCYIVCIFIGHLLQCRFWPAASGHLGAAYGWFVKPGGICSLLGRWSTEEELPPGCIESSRRELDAAFGAVLGCLGAALGEVVQTGRRAAFRAGLPALHAELAAALCPRAGAGGLSVGDHERVDLLWERLDGARWAELCRRVMRSTPLTAVWLLCELRGRFQSADFQERYWALRRRVMSPAELVELALTVQSVVLPKYGFAGTVSGVNQMRNEVGVFIHRGDRAVQKVMRDIHNLLDHGVPVPKVPTIRSVAPPRFGAEDSGGWLPHLAREGFAVIAGVAGREEVASAYDLLWDFIEQSDPEGRVRRHDLRTWQNGRRAGEGWPAAPDTGIIFDRGVGQSEAMWYLRALPRLRRVFAAIWGTDLLVTSFDGAGVFRPYGHNSAWQTTKRHWCHVDQAHYKRGLHCVQGLVTLKDATPESGGFVVVPGSHRFHNHILRHQKWLGKDSVHLNPNDPVICDGESRPRLVNAMAGDLIIWDSRTIHCNTLPIVMDEGVMNGKDLMRAVAYICMTPAVWCPDTVAQQRERAFRNGVTTTHWPHEHHVISRVAGHAPTFSLTREQRELLWPQVSGSWREAGAFIPKRGRISVLPERTLRVLRAGVPVWRSPHHDRGEQDHPLDHLQAETEVRGHAFGEWLLLSSVPSATSAFNDVEETWAPMCSEEQGGRNFQFLD